MRSAAETRKRAEEDRLQVRLFRSSNECIVQQYTMYSQAKLAAMTPEERVEHERERASEVRREARKSRMLQTTIGAICATTNAQEVQ